MQSIKKALVCLMVFTTVYVSNAQVKSKCFELAFAPLFNRHYFNTSPLYTSLGGSGLGSGLGGFLRMAYSVKENQKIYFGLGLNFSDMYINFLTADTPLSEFATVIDILGLELSASYSYDVQLAKKFYLVPELGISTSFLYLKKSNLNNQGVDIRLKQTPTPLFGVEPKLWLKYSVNTSNNIKIGANGLISTHKVDLANFKIVKTGEAGTIKQGLHYFSWVIAYDRLF